MEKVELVSVDKDALVRIKRSAEDLAELLRGLESTARIIHTLGMADNPLSIETIDMAHMMSAFREQLTTIIDSVEEISDTAFAAVAAHTGKVKAVK